MIQFHFNSAFFHIAVALCLMSPHALSADKGENSKWTATKMFEKKDIDMDGFLSIEEFKHGRSEKFLENAEKRFSVLDTNHDEKVSLEELKAGWADMTRNKKK